MGRLIDADALKAALGMKDDCSECKDTWKACHYDRIYSKMDFCEWIDDAPTVDAVQVVRCKECKYGEQDDYGWICTNIDGGIMGDENGNGFCCEGERREE